MSDFQLIPPTTFTYPHPTDDYDVDVERHVRHLPRVGEIVNLGDGHPHLVVAGVGHDLEHGHRTVVRCLPFPAS